MKSVLLLLPLAAIAATPQPRRLDTGVEKALQQYLAQQARANGIEEASFELSLLSTEPPPGPCGTPLSIEPLDARSASRMRLVAVCASATTPWRYEFIARADITADVVVAASSIGAKKTIAPGDLRVESAPLANLSDATSSIDSVAGKTSRRPLRPGQVVLKRFLEATQLVHRGQAVRIAVRRGAVEVMGSGEAMEAGSLGDTVRVRNASSGKTIQARVIGEAAVEPVDMFPMPASPQSAN